jgi:carbon monoxide dehydrogenase subunit G
MKRGATVSTMGGGSRGNVQMNVSVKNYTDGNIQVRRINQTDVEIIATQVAERTVQERTPRLVANEIRNSNSRISKSLTDSTQTRRRR